MKHLKSMFLIIALVFVMILVPRTCLASEIDQYTKLLLHMDEGTFKDEIGNAVTNNGVILDAETKKFGNGSGNLTNTLGQYLSIADSDDWHFGAEDFTIDFWIYFNNFDGVSHTLFNQRQSPSEYCPVQIALTTSNELVVYLSFNNTAWASVPTINAGVLSTSTWNHIALVRSSGVFKLFVNGIQKGNSYTNTTSFTNKSSPLALFGQPGGTTTNGMSMNGYIDEFRISKGIARWTSNFTPPSISYGFDLNAPTNINLIPGNARVDVSWSAITGATSYNIKRSNNAGGPYTTIASNLTTTTYSDTSVVNGTKYYYVVTAVSAIGESSNSNEVSTIPLASSINRGILTITLLNGVEKEYDLSMDEVNAFIKWYESRATGTGSAFYSLPKNKKTLPFLNRNDYIIFDKILIFDVDEYNER